MTLSIALLGAGLFATEGQFYSLLIVSDDDDDDEDEDSPLFF